MIDTRYLRFCVKFNGFGKSNYEYMNLIQVLKKFLVKNLRFPQVLFHGKFFNTKKIMKYPSLAEIPGKI